MSTPSTTSDSSALGDDSGQWPVLARLPDVSDQLQPAAGRSQRAAAGFVNYRFDPPATVERRRRAADASGPARATPNIIQRRGHGRGSGESAILPSSNPFAIPRTSLTDSLEPVVRFLFLFILFTVAGTWILTSSRRETPDNDLAEPVTTAAQPSLEPQTLKAAPPVVDAPASAPTAAGPLNSKAPRTGLRTKEGNRSAGPNSQSAVAPVPTAPRTARSNWQLLPQVQTTDAQTAASEGASAVPPATARLSGSILAAPTHQAQHDDNESSFH